MSHVAQQLLTYITPEGAGNLPKYQYKGQDRSLIYKHIYTPMNNWLIQWFPMWMAPNTITILGLSFVIFSHLLMLYYAPKLEGEAPPWAYIVNGVFIFVYSTLDNLDGKQARRTGSASALGLFFDHGCDALNCTLGTTTLLSSIQMGATWKSFFALLSTIFVFYLNTWEEYYTGELILPIVNGATEGLLVCASLHWWTAFKGPAFWLQTFPISVPKTFTFAVDELALRYIPTYVSVVEEVEATGYLHVQYNTLVMVAMVALALLTTIGNVWKVMWSVRADGHTHGQYADTWLQRHFPFLHALTRLLPMTILAALACVWVAFSPVGIIQQHPRLVCWTIGLLFAKLVTHLMLAHLCAMEYHPLRRTLLPMFFFGGHVALDMAINHKALSIDEGLMLYEFFLLAVVTYLHMVFGVIGEMKKILGIQCFSIPKRKA
eukprot:NODE_1461_length_1496_cov_69.593134_g1383_i0.p1 GENE.NODE_1461_length_1496_cov_69.593134_g1383_i0~~NODE_1461_length_1496_cov_69.593134_g1383_i0.p1  ORF type:complete len:433 (+),score=120.96 NODE_1461_length_1496_cov_69.593134_g1383_i0:67-1365(+)